MKSIYPGSRQRVIEKINELVPLNVTFDTATKKASRPWAEINKALDDGRPVIGTYIDGDHDERGCIVTHNGFFGAHTTAAGKIRVFTAYGSGVNVFNGFHADITKTGNM